MSNIGSQESDLFRGPSFTQGVLIM